VTVTSLQMSKTIWQIKTTDEGPADAKTGCPHKHLRCCGCGKQLRRKIEPPPKETIFGELDLESLDQWVAGTKKP